MKKFIIPTLVTVFSFLILFGFVQKVSARVSLPSVEPVYQLSSGFIETVTPPETLKTNGQGCNMCQATCLEKGNDWDDCDFWCQRWCGGTTSSIIAPGGVSIQERLLSIQERLLDFSNIFSNIITSISSPTERTTNNISTINYLFGFDGVNNLENFFGITPDNTFGTADYDTVSSFNTVLRTATSNLPIDVKSLSIFDADGNSKKFNVGTGSFQSPPADSFGSGTGQTLPSSTNPKGVTNPVVNMYVICSGNASDPDGGYWWCNQNIAGNNCDEWILWHYYNGPGACKIGAGAL